MKTIIIILSTTICFAQSSIVASGNSTYTVGEVFPIMQQDIKPNEVSLGVPTFEVPVPEPKPIVKKKSLLQKIIELLLKLFKTNKK